MHRLYDLQGVTSHEVKYFIFYNYLGISLIPSTTSLKSINQQKDI